MKTIEGKAPETAATNTKSAGGKSKTPYPYNDLNDSIEVARAIQERAGGVCGNEHLAEFLGYSSPRSGTYFSRVQAAKMFGLIHAQGNNLSPTERAHAILSPVMPDDEARARFEAFVSVPLFKAVFEQFRGMNLPPDVGIKNLLKTKFGIVEDRINPAFRILMDSAEQAGLFKTTGGRSKMIAPIMGIGLQPSASSTKTPDSLPPQDRIDKPKFGGGSGEGPPGGVHTAIIGLLRELPPAGAAWPRAKKEKFLGAFKAIIDVVYPDNEEAE